MDANKSSTCVDSLPPALDCPFQLSLINPNDKSQFSLSTTSLTTRRNTPSPHTHDLEDGRKQTIKPATTIKKAAEELPAISRPLVTSPTFNSAQVINRHDINVQQSSSEDEHLHSEIRDESINQQKTIDMMMNLQSSFTTIISHLQINASTPLIMKLQNKIASLCHRMEVQQSNNTMLHLVQKDQSTKIQNHLHEISTLNGNMEQLKCQVTALTEKKKSARRQNSCTQQ